MTPAHSPTPRGSPSLPPALHPCSLLLDSEIKPPDFVIRPFFPSGELTEIVGAHGNFKSTIALDACLAVASGRPWGGVPTRQGRSVFITLEDSADTLARRVKAWLDGVYENAEPFAGPQEVADVERALLANFAYLSREDAQALVLSETRDGTTSARVDVANHVAKLTQGASLVVLETLSRLHDGPETNDAFAALIRSLERVTVNGCALVVVRHMSKKAAREMTADALDSYAGRGGSALSDAARSVLVVTRAPGYGLSPVTLTAAKTTHAKSGETISWSPVVVPALESVRLERRDPSTQCTDDANVLFAHIDAKPNGVAESHLHKDPPPGLGRRRALAALDLLRANDRLVQREERRGRNRQLVTVYYTPRAGREAA